MEEKPRKQETKGGAVKQEITTNEIIVNGTITLEDVEKYNSKAPLTITIKNTRGQDPRILSKLNNNISIRVKGPYDEKAFPKYANNRFLSKTIYSPAEISALINMLNEIESGIIPEWSDLEKATYSYLTLMRNISPKHTKEDSEDKSEYTRPLTQILEGKSDSMGFAFMYKELLERNEIPCRYYQNSSGQYAWNEVLINGEYYPVDLYADSLANEEALRQGAFELRNFLSDKEFYYKKEHQLGSETELKQKQAYALDHSKVQEAINNILDREKYAKKEIPPISLKSKELQNLFGTDEISSEENFGKRDEIRITLEGQDTEALKDDLIEIGKYYPKALDNIILANDTDTHIDMQQIVDAIYEAKTNEYSQEGVKPSPTQIVIESSIQEDFDLDFSKAPRIEVDDTRERTEDDSNSQKVAFVNTSSKPLNLRSLSGRIPDNIDTISIENFELDGFVINPISSHNNKRRLELKGGNTHGIAHLGGLDNIAAITITGISDSEFDDVMRLAAGNPPAMSGLFELNINNQRLANRAILSEIVNPNIVKLDIRFSNMNNITGLDAIKDRLIRLDVQGNNLSIDDLKQVSNISRQTPYFQRCLYNNIPLNNAINGLRGDIISNDTYNYLDSYFRRSGYEEYRNFQYTRFTNTAQRKKEMLKDLGRWDIEKVPYFIEDAKVMRDILPYTYNPMMVKDLQTFENYLNDPSNYFEQDHLKDGILWLTKEQLTSLINSGKKIPQNIFLKINTASELTVDEIDSLKASADANGLNLNGVAVFDDRCLDPLNPDVHNFDQKDTYSDPYDIDEYKKIRESLDKIVDGILPSMTDAEKFAIVYQRLSEKIAEYDDSAVGTAYTKEYEIYKAKMRNKSRNLSEGLIEQEGFDIGRNAPNGVLANRAVCAGYADILKNALDLAGVQCVLDSGYARYNKTKKQGEGGHAWNKVNIDGKWYYADLCWDNGKNVRIRGTYGYALKGARSFEHSNNIRNINSEVIEEGCHLTRVKPGVRNEQMEQDDFDQVALKELFHKVKTGEIFQRYEITIPEDPDLSFNQPIDVDRIKDEYKRRKDDMLAKYYGDKSYQEKYNEVAERYRANEVEVSDGTITYRTVQDYAEKEDDEKFLILGEYKDSLERMTRYDAGDTSVYSGTPDQISAQYEKDKQYVETRNFTFDQHKNTQKDLATLGKFGEKMPYIPKQTGIVKNGLRLVGNAGIFARNLVAPVYRFIGKNVAQPLHRAITRGKDASPYRNNPYHRFVARRDYFRDVAKQQDQAEGKNHPLRNYIMSNINAIVNYEEGNEAVLNAGAYDIQNNLKQQEMQRMELDFLNSKKAELEAQITALEAEILNHADAKNIGEAKSRLMTKKLILGGINTSINSVRTTGKIVDIQTDAISQKQHDIASKEVNTYRVAAIKGVAKLGIRKFIGPKIKDWLLEHTKQKVIGQEEYTEIIEVETEVPNDPISVPIMEEVPDYDIEVDDLIQRASGRTVRMYRSVSGGNKGEVAYTIGGDELCTGFHFQNGSTWGTGFSSNVPLMTDQHWPASFLDASNKLREDLTFSEIAQAISTGELSEEALETMTLQIGNRGWVYASELFEGVTKKVQTGTQLVSGGTHIELIPETVVRTRDVVNWVENERVLRSLNTLGVTLDTAGKVDTVHNVGEILRPTDTDIQTNKNNSREYSYNDSEFYR